MSDNQDKLDKLLSRFEILFNQQQQFSKEVDSLREEINQLSNEVKYESVGTDKVEADAVTAPIPKQPKVSKIHEATTSSQHKPESTKPLDIAESSKKRKRLKTDLEKFIGENLINKIGIAITIIGVGIGVKYSIDHDLVTPLIRVISGYVTGIAMLLIGLKLKTNYEHYSAVLVSGAMAIMYFITFAAYSFYGLMPLSLAFGVMVIFTVFTVLASISYNQQVISLIGLVGAYAVPFLLSDDSGNVKILLSYIVIINIGVLAVAVLRYWKLLYYSAFILSWIIFGFWYVEDFQLDKHFSLTLIFSVIFFLTFYATLLTNKLLKKEKFNPGDIVFLIINSFVFYGIGYATLDQHETGVQLLGLFTVGNALIHFVVSVIVFRQRMSDRNLFFLVVGMVLVFITIAIPVQLDGKWVTLLWIGEALLLFWIGRVKSVPVYEKMSYPLILLAFFSLLHDWSEVYDRYIPNDAAEMIMPVFNVQFLSSLIFISCLGIILFLFTSEKYKAPKMLNLFSDLLKYFVPVLLLFTVFFAIRNEIANYWNQLLALSEIETGGGDEYSTSISNYSLHYFKDIWIINYSLIFFSVLSLANMYKLKNVVLARFNLLFNMLVMLVFLGGGLYAISELREAYLSQNQGEYYDKGMYYLVMRYISFVFVLGLIMASYYYLRQKLLKRDFNIEFGVALHISAIWILSSELIHWLDIYGSSEAYKLGLSILWGSYSLMMIILGIWKHKKYLRIMGIAIFGITLVKLFVYDVSHLDTIPKTILFVSLGILLLIISFLYNKYKHIISDEA